MTAIIASLALIAPINISTQTQPTIEQMIIDVWTSNGYPQYAQQALRVARCESGLNPNARNRRSSASGLYQLLKPHWKNKFNPFDPQKNIEKAFYLFRPAKGRVGFDKHWRASQRCWAK